MASAGGEIRKGVKRVAADVEGNFSPSILQPAYRLLKKLLSKPAALVSVIPTTQGCFVSDRDGQRATWTEDFE